MRTRSKRFVSSRRIGWLLVALAAAALLGGCGQAGGAASTGEHEQPLYAAGYKIWRTLDIPVCWENPGAASSTERGWVQSAIANSWQAVSDLTFVGWGTCSANSPGIRIRISDEHPHAMGLGRYLDGMSGGVVLNFTYNNWGSTYCQAHLQYCDQVIAVHEFGHALGFAHEQNRPDRPASCADAPQGPDGDTLVGPFDNDSVMNYCNPTWSNGGVLSAGDISGVRQYYGSPTFAANPKDAVNWGNGKAYFFNGSQYTRYDIAADKTDDGYPLPIAGNFPGWPSTWSSGIDAAINWGNGKVYFFKGSEYLRYDIALDKVDDGYPRPIAGNWGNWPATWTSVDAAVMWGGKAYFFRGSEYLRYDVAADSVDDGYPVSIAGRWPGLWTSGIEYALSTTFGKVYFFKGRQYLRYDMLTDQTDSGYPLPIVGYWPGVPF